MTDVQLNSIPEITCDHPFIQHLDGIILQYYYYYNTYSNYYYVKGPRTLEVIHLYP